MSGRQFRSLINRRVRREAPEAVTSGPGIFVERALYSDAQGVVFAAGTNALATRLP
jgi:hypothetical protein